VRLASYLFECFTPYWIEMLLKQGHDTIGALFSLIFWNLNPLLKPVVPGTKDACFVAFVFIE
jgi:hypothetical protein